MKQVPQSATCHQHNMTDLIVTRGDTFPRSYLDTYRSSQYYHDLKTSKSDELVLQPPADIPPVSNEMQHGHSENILDNESEFLDKTDMIIPRSRRKRVSVYDRVDPEDSIRDIVSDNDFYRYLFIIRVCSYLEFINDFIVVRFVLFKKHYDKYLHLSQKYEEARNIAYYLEEKYHEVKVRRNFLFFKCKT